MPGKPPASSPVNPLRCPVCGHYPLEPRFFSWKKPLSILLKCTLVLFPLGLMLTAKSDWDECPKCGRKKVNL